MRKYFITGTGTGIGKTYVIAALCRKFKEDRKKVAAYKPVVSGYETADLNSDTAIILGACGLGQEYAAAISPWRFAAALSPNMAAAREGKTIGFEALVAFCREQEKRPCDVLLVEGVGGVMVPLNNKYTVRDWIEALGWPVILVGGSYLGSLSHTLSAFESLSARGIAPQVLVISESADASVPLAETVETLRYFLPKSLCIIALPRDSDEALGELLP